MSYVLQMCVPSYERNRVMVIILSITFYTRSLLPLIFLTSPTTAHRTINTPPSTSNLHKTKRPLSTFPHSFTLGPLNFSLSFSHIMLTHSYLISTHDLPVLNLSLSSLHNPLNQDLLILSIVLQRVLKPFKTFISPIMTILPLIKRRICENIQEMNLKLVGRLGRQDLLQPIKTQIISHRRRGRQSNSWRGWCRCWYSRVIWNTC